jgi:hypothetical protein
MKKFNLLVCALFLVTIGCDPSRVPLTKKPVVSDTTDDPLIERIKTPQLARMILKPQKAELKVSRDPFTPLFTSKEEAKANSPQVNETASPIEDLIFLGVVRMNEEYLALLKDNLKKGLFRVNEKVKDFTITDIQEDEVTLNNGVRTIKIKRGDNP